MEKRVSSVEKKPRPTAEQHAAATVAFVLELHDSCSRMAKGYVKEIAKEERLTKKAKRKEVASVLIDLYLAKKSGAPEELFQAKWAQPFSDLLDASTMNELQQREEQYQISAGEYTLPKRVKIAVQAAYRMKRVPKEQEAQLLELTGYSHTEGTSLAKKIAISTGATTGLGVGAMGVVGAASFVEKVTHFGNLETMSDPKTAALVLLSYGLHYSAIGLNGETNYHLLNDKTVKNSPNVWPTLLYHLLKKVAPNTKLNLPRVGTHVGTVTPIIWQEVGFIPAMFVPGGAEVVFARNMAGAAINGIEGILFRRSQTVRKILSGEKKLHKN